MAVREREGASCGRWSKQRLPVYASQWPTSYMAFIFAIFHLLITDTLYSWFFAIAMGLDMLEQIALVRLNWILVWNVCRTHSTARGTRRDLHLVY